MQSGDSHNFFLFLEVWKCDTSSSEVMSSKTFILAKAEKRVVRWLSKFQGFRFEKTINFQREGYQNETHCTKQTYFISSKESFIFTLSHNDLSNKHKSTKSTTEKGFFFCNFSKTGNEVNNALRCFPSVHDSLWKKICFRYVTFNVCSVVPFFILKSLDGTKVVPQLFVHLGNNHVTVFTNIFSVWGW